MKWILIIAWASNGTGYTMHTFNSETACVAARNWAAENNFRGGGPQGIRATCIKDTP